MQKTGTYKLPPITVPFNIITLFHCILKCIFFHLQDLWDIVSSGFYTGPDIKEVLKQYEWIGKNKANSLVSTSQNLKCLRKNNQLKT